MNRQDHSFDHPLQILPVYGNGFVAFCQFLLMQHHVSQGIRSIVTKQTKQEVIFKVKGFSENHNKLRNDLSAHNKM